MLLCGAAAWLVTLGLTDLVSAHLLWRQTWAAQSTMVGPALVLVVVAVFVAERFWPAVRRPVGARAHAVDAGYLLVYALAGPLVTLLDTGFALEVERHARFLILGRLGLGSQLLVVGLILLGIDAMNWAAHVANHRAATLWRFHALHHSQVDMSVLTTFRTHPVAHVSYLPALLPALVLGASGTVPAAALVCYGCLVTLPHANLRWTYGRLGTLLVSPAFHRLHHAETPPGGRRAVNFGFVLTVWDRLAGTAAFPYGLEPCATGIKGRPVPLEQDESTPRTAWRVMAAQLVQPLRLHSGLQGGR